MARDFWQTYRQAVKVGKTNKTLTIPSFSVICGKPKGCLEFTTEFDDVLGYSTALPEGIINQFFLELWIKPKTKLLSRRQTLVSFWMGARVDWSFSLSLIGRTLSIWIKKDDIGTEFISLFYIDSEEWQHVGVKFQNNIFTFYKNGVPETTTHFFEGPLEADYQTNSFVLGSNGAAGQPFDFYFGLLDELRIWDIPPSDEEIFYQYDKLRNPNQNVTLDESLRVYFDFSYPLNFGVSTKFTNVRNGAGLVSAPGITLGTSQANKVLYNTDDNAPVGLGGPFVATEFPVSLSNKIALKYPVDPPEDNNFALVVRWTDDNDVVQKRRLFTAEGNNDTICALIPLEYSGETLSTDFVFEIWNVDGEPTVDLTEDLVIKTSLLKNATDVLDSDIESLGTLVEDSLNYAAFPFSFDQDFVSAYAYGLQTWNADIPWLLQENGHAVLDEDGIGLTIE